MKKLLLLFGAVPCLVLTLAVGSAQAQPLYSGHIDRLKIHVYSAAAGTDDVVKDRDFKECDVFVEAGLELDCSDGMIVILPNVGTLDLPSSGPPKKLLIVATGAFDEAIGSGPAFFDGHIHKIKFVGSDVTGFKLSGKLRGADQGGGYLWDARLDVFMEQTP